MYSSRAGLIGYIFASWMREEIDLHKELTKQNEKIEQVMLQLQQDHQTGKLRSNSAQNSRQNSRENRESEGSGSDFTLTFMSILLCNVLQCDVKITNVIKISSS